MFIGLLIGIFVYMGMILVGSLFGAVVLRLAAGWVKAPVPRYRRALVIMIVGSFAVMALSILLGLATMGALYATGAINNPQPPRDLMWVYILLPRVLLLLLTPPALGGIICFLLPTSFGKALAIGAIITGVWIVMIIAVAIVVAAIAGAF